MKLTIPTYFLLTCFAETSNASIRGRKLQPPEDSPDTATATAPAGSQDEDGYVYTIETDCYREDVECPAGTFCQVEARDNWYPYDVSYISRGRCLPYAKLGGACDVPFEGTTSYPRLEDGGFFERSTLCAPDLTCTGSHVFVVPPTCVEARDPSKGCMSTQRNGCAGRPSLAECPDDSFCFFPQDDEPAEEVAATTTTNPNGGMTRTKLEQCASLVTSFNGPNFVFTMEDGSHPDDNHIEAGETKPMTKHALEHGSRMAPNVQHILEALWPYPVCHGEDEGASDGCTSFPLPVPARDNDGGLIGGKCLEFASNGTQIEVDCDSLNNPVDMSFLPADSSSGATDYHCTWATLHTIAFNGGAVLSAKEKRAMGELIMYISGQFDCKVCRSNFVQIIKHFGLPEGNIREDYARWLWQAHNNANEHSYATHSKNLMQVEAELGDSAETIDPFTMTRTDSWVNPTYEHAWYMTFEDAERVWANIIEGI